MILHRLQGELELSYALCEILVGRNSQIGDRHAAIEHCVVCDFKVAGLGEPVDDDRLGVQLRGVVARQVICRLFCHRCGLLNAVRGVFDRSRFLHFSDGPCVLSLFRKLPRSISKAVFAPSEFAKQTPKERLRGVLVDNQLPADSNVRQMPARCRGATGGPP